MAAAAQADAVLAIAACTREITGDYARFKFRAATICLDFDIKIKKAELAFFAWYVYNKKIVAKLKKIKNPPESVSPVIITEPPSAGSRPKRVRSIGINTPALEANNRFKIVAAVITSPSG